MQNLGMLTPTEKTILRSHLKVIQEEGKGEGTGKGVWHIAMLFFRMKFERPKEAILRLH